MSHLSNAAEAVAAVARTITDDQLANKTPCTEYDVRALVNHILFWGPSLAGAGRKESVPQPAAAEALAKADRAWLARLITRQVPLAQWQEAVQRAPDDVKVVITINPV